MAAGNVLAQDIHAQKHPPGVVSSVGVGIGAMRRGIRVGPAQQLALVADEFVLLLGPHCPQLLAQVPTTATDTAGQQMSKTTLVRV